MNGAENSPTDVNRLTVERLRCSQVYRNFEQAFEEATGLPLSLRVPGAVDLPHRDHLRENPFCALMGSVRPACTACLQLQTKLEKMAALRPTTLTCFAGCCVSAVPFRVREDLTAFLRTGQVLVTKPTKPAFARVACRLKGSNPGIDLVEAEATFFRTRVVTEPHYQSYVDLLATFAQHLSAICDRFMLQGPRPVSGPVVRAKAFIRDHGSEELTLGGVARAVDLSRFYFCKIFRKETGLHFTEYLARLRVERAKDLLADTQTRIGEVAFAVGFRSLSQFERAFRKVTGEAPSAYRKRLRAAMNPKLAYLPGIVSHEAMRLSNGTAAPVRHNRSPESGPFSGQTDVLPVP